MKEKQIYPIFKKINKEIGVFEIKLAKSNSIPFDSVKDHQVKGLMDANSDVGLYHKISDMPQSFYGGNKNFRFVKPKPFDIFFVKNFPAYVVICFYVPRKRKTFYYITPQKWIDTAKKSPRKSITEKDIREISSKILSI